jgi:hypothetical protein
VPAGDYVVPGASVFPEGIAAEASTGTVFVGSTSDGTILRAAGPGAPCSGGCRAGATGAPP